MKRFLSGLAYIGLLAALLGSCQGAEVGFPQPLILEVGAPADGATLHSNLATVRGMVSDPQAEVRVGTAPAAVGEDGSYLAVVELAEGPQTLTVTAETTAAEVSRTLALTFVPPLVVTLDSLRYDSTVDYSQPVPVTGAVSDPRAGVVVNGAPAIVGPDGHFRADVLLAVDRPPVGIEAVARLDGQEDRATTSMQFGPPPILLMPPPDSSLTAPGDLVLRVGSSQSYELTLAVGKSYRRTPVDWQVLSVAGINSTEAVPAPAGLAASLTPARFTVYPNSQCTLRLNLAASPSLAPGSYRLYIRGERFSNPFFPWTFAVRVEA